jgi:hypothetical protein
MVKTDLTDSLLGGSSDAGDLLDAHIVSLLNKDEPPSTDEDIFHDVQKKSKKKPCSAGIFPGMVFQPKPWKLTHVIYKLAASSWKNTLILAAMATVSLYLFEFVPFS